MLAGTILGNGISFLQQLPPGQLTLAVSAAGTAGTAIGLILIIMLNRKWSA